MKNSTDLYLHVLVTQSPVKTSFHSVILDSFSGYFSFPIISLSKEGKHKLEIMCTVYLIFHIIGTLTV